MKIIFFTIALISLLGPAGLAQAQFNREARADASIDAAQEMLAWMQQSGAVAQELIPLVSDDLLGQLIAPITDENIDLVALKASTAAYAESRTEILKQAQARIDAMPAPEKWNFDPSLFSSIERGIYKATRRQYADLQDTYDYFASISGDFISTMERISNEDEVDFQALMERISEGGIRLMRSENLVLEAFSAAMPSSSPNKNFHEIMLALNHSSMIEAKMLADYTAGEDPLSKRQSFGSQMKSALKNVPENIQSGREKIDSEIQKNKNILKKSELTKKQRELMEALIPAMRSFDESFDVEQALHDLDLSNANLYMSNRTDEDIEIEVEANDSKYFELIEQRTNIMLSRMASLQ